MVKILNDQIYFFHSYNIFSKLLMYIQIFQEGNTLKKLNIGKYFRTLSFSDQFFL